LAFGEITPLLVEVRGDVRMLADAASEFWRSGTQFGRQRG